MSPEISEHSLTTIVHFFNNSPLALMNFVVGLARLLNTAIRHRTMTGSLEINYNFASLFAPFFPSNRNLNLQDNYNRFAPYPIAL